MAKKRGGLAGFYDRNKKIIKPVAAGLAGMLGTPALGAAVGAAFGGLDREGKSGIGVDLGGAAKGGLSGYAAGQLGGMAGKAAGIGKVGALEQAGKGLSGGLKGLLTGSKATAPGAEALQRGTASMNKGLSMIDGAGGAGVNPMSGPAVGGGGGGKGISISGLLKGARENKDLIALGGKGIQSMLPDAASDAAMMNAETARKRLELEQGETEEERRRKENIAKLLMPMYQQLYASRG